MRVITLLSGGQDSTTCLFWAMRRWPRAEHYALSFDYGQRHRVELDRAREIARAAGCADHLVVRVGLDAIGGSALVDHDAKLEAPPGALPTSFVPGRNLVFLGLATGWAARLGARRIIFGANEVDFSGYPDCRYDFIVAAEKAARLAIDASPLPEPLCFFTPLLDRNKAQIVALARDLGPTCWAAIGRSWTCYDPQRSFEQHVPHCPAIPRYGACDCPPQTREYTGDPKPCGACPACEIRARGFAAAGEEDPAR